MNDSTKAVALQTPVSATDGELTHLMKIAVEQGESGVAALERLVAMRERAAAHVAESEFNLAMSRVQAKMGRISTNATNPQTHSRYATYGKLDQALRPLYTDAGFALSFDTEPHSEREILVTCHVTHAAGHSRKYSIPMPTDGLGPKGNAVQTRTHATGGAAQYGMRYLLKLIFNVAIGEEENDGAGPGRAQRGEETITDQQAADLEALAQEVGADWDAYLRWLGVDRVEDLRMAYFDKAVRGLEAKR